MKANIMTQAQYRVVFHGQVDADRDVDEVKHNIGVLFKTSGDQVDRLFAKPTVVIKRGVDYQVAMSYKSALQKAGAVCHVESLGSHEPQDASLDVQQSPAGQAHPDASTTPPFLPLISSAFSYPLQGHGKYIVAGGVLFSLLASFFGLLFGILAGVYIGAYLMKIISESADGEDDLPEWLDLEFWADEIIRPYALMLGVAIVSYLPALLYMHHVSFIMSPNYVLLGVLLALGALYAPMGLAATSVLKTLNALNPLLVIQSLSKIPRDYTIVCGLFLVAVGVSWINMGGLLGAVFGKLLGFYLLMVCMRLLGLLCRSHEARLGWFDY
jgi:uncharacterized membrane protein required for colicin V production